MCVSVHIAYVCTCVLFLLFIKQKENAHIIFYFVPLYIRIDSYLYRKRPLLISLQKEAKRIMCWFCFVCVCVCCVVVDCTLVMFYIRTRCLFIGDNVSWYSFVFILLISNRIKTIFSRKQTMTKQKNTKWRHKSNSLSSLWERAYWVKCLISKIRF